MSSSIALRVYRAMDACACLLAASYKLLIYCQYRPVRLHGVERSTSGSSVSAAVSLPLPPNEPALAQVFADHLNSTSSDLDIDPTVLKLDRNYEYNIWLSYAEVYNEKIFDLLANVKEDGNRLEQ